MVQKLFRSIGVFGLIFLLLEITCAHTTRKYRKKPNKILIRADKQFNELKYKEAVENYKTIFEKDTGNHYANYQIAECYRLLFQYDESIKYYKMLTNSSKGISRYPFSFFWLGFVYKDQNKCDEAVKYFQQYLKQMEGVDVETRIYEEKVRQGIEECAKNQNIK